MNKPVNLNKFQKRKAQLKKVENSKLNSVKFGQTKTNKNKQKILNSIQESRLNQLKLSPNGATQKKISNAKWSPN